MKTLPVYIVIAIVVLATITGFLIFTGRRYQQSLPPVAGLSYTFILTGFIYGQERWSGLG